MVAEEVTETIEAADPVPLDPAAIDPQWAEVAEALGRPETHGIDEAVVRIDTHAAVVFLAGRLALKIKRPVRFPFLDFSTLERREAACRREIAIDRPIAREIYRRVVRITRAPDGRIRIGGDGPVLEWAVEMNRFDETATLDRRLERGPLPADLVEALAVAVADAQSRAPVADWRRWRDDLAAYVDQNEQAFAARPDLFEPAAARRLAELCRTGLADLGDLIETRGRMGLVRVGHGDLHAGNIAVIDGRPQLFDAIEFDDRIATGDLLYDSAFLVMDLCAAGDRPAGRRFLDRLTIESVRREARRSPGRPIAEVLLSAMDGLAGLPLWLAIRAALRAKIAAATVAAAAPAARPALEARGRSLFDAALGHLDPVDPVLVAIGGLSGAGKSTLAATLAPRLDPTPGAVVLRSDRLRKLLAGVEETVALPPASYDRALSDRVYDLLATAAARALAAGRSVIVDAVFLAPEERLRMAAIAVAAERPFVGLWLDVPGARAVERVATRVADASDAGAAVVAFQLDRDPGPIDWHRLDAAGPPERVAEAAADLLGGLIPLRR